MPHGRERPGVFPPDVRGQATAIACSLPRPHAVPLARWSRAALARASAAHPELPHISPSTIGRWLQAERIRPWRYRMWQHIPHPAAFLERARPVLSLYAQATALLQAGTWVVCAEEKTSIQARAAEQPPRAARGRHGARPSPRDTCRGARHVLAGLSVADGQVYGQCSRRKRFCDFQRLVEQGLVVEAQRRGVQTIALILDNGPPHAPKQLERWVQAQATQQQWGGGIPGVLAATERLVA